MNLPPSARISIDTLISDLRLDHMPFMLALKTILLFTKHYGLPICFDEDVESVLDADEETGPWFDENNIRLDFRDSGYWIPLLEGPKRIYDARPYQSEINGEYRLLVSCISQDGKYYYMPHESGVDLTELDLDLDSFYCEIDALEAFIKRMDINKQPDATATVTPRPTRSGAFKALALLARETAEQKLAYRNGETVNASAYKDHILTLAEKYGQTDSGLKTLDDEISKSLKHLDIKELHKQ